MYQSKQTFIKLSIVQKPFNKLKNKITIPGQIIGVAIAHSAPQPYSSAGPVRVIVTGDFFLKLNILTHDSLIHLNFNVVCFAIYRDWFGGR